jgi:hypothetical protein
MAEFVARLVMGFVALVAQIVVEITGREITWRYLRRAGAPEYRAEEEIDRVNAWLRTQPNEPLAQSPTSGAEQKL